MGARWEQLECGLALLKINWGIGMMAMAYYIHESSPSRGNASARPRATAR